MYNRQRGTDEYGWQSVRRDSRRRLVAVPEPWRDRAEPPAAAPGPRTDPDPGPDPARWRGLAERALRGERVAVRLCGVDLVLPTGLLEYDESGPRAAHALPRGRALPRSSLPRRAVPAAATASTKNMRAGFGEAALHHLLVAVLTAQPSGPSGAAACAANPGERAAASAHARSHGTKSGHHLAAGASGERQGLLPA